MSEPLTPERLAEIRACPICVACDNEDQYCLVPVLLAEVDRLRAALAAVLEIATERRGEPTGLSPLEMIVANVRPALEGR